MPLALELTSQTWTRSLESVSHPVLSSVFKSLDKLGEMVVKVKGSPSFMKVICNMPNFGAKERMPIDNFKS